MKRPVKQIESIHDCVARHGDPRGGDSFALRKQTNDRHQLHGLGASADDTNEPHRISVASQRCTAEEAPTVFFRGRSTNTHELDDLILRPRETERIL